MNYCDHDHSTNEEVRLLPYSSEGNVIVCQRHFHEEMAYRKERIQAGAQFELPRWEDLKVYEGAP